MSKRFYVFLFLLVVVGLLLLVVSAGAQSSSGEKPNPDPAALSGSNHQPRGLNSQDRMSSMAISSWSRIAYQKLVGNNWDIYLFDSSGSRRLTTNAADDLYPSIDRGGTRVAFSSGRNDANGKLNLYTMNFDKTGLKQIVTGWTAFPAWSPDGETIAFQALVVDQYEIFIVDADGSNLRRLTNNPGFDGQPTWSPDGKKLAFASWRGGQYSIYIINEDATSLRKLSSYPLSLHPTWSPDGEYVGFDADVDGDGWQELALIKANGSDQKMVYNPGPSATAWAGSWSPDDRYLGFTEISLIQQGGQWIWTKGMIRQWDMLSDVVKDIVPGDTNWYFDWQTLDILAPVTQINPVQPYSAADKFYFTWSGIDYGGSGLRTYSVHYRPSSSGNWQIYWGDTIATGALFEGTPGETVDFLVRAKDNAFNEGIWWKQPTVTTTFYNTKISGTIVDNRGTPLSSVPVNIVPAPIFPVVSDNQGQYEGYTAAPGLYKLSTAQAGYKTTPPTDTVPDEDFLRTLTLLPADTLLTNGTFEATGFLVPGWQTAGGLPVVTSGEAQATGKFSVRMGNATTNAAEEEKAITIGTLTQEVTVLTNLQAPTLAFMAKAMGDSGGDGSGLEVVILPNGGTEQVIFNDRLGDKWALYWLSMQPWLGQNVKVIFRVTQDSGNPPLTVYLDDVSLGSAHPELWVGLNAIPRSAVKGEIVTLTIDYGNRGGLPAINGKMEMTLDPALSFVSANPPAVQNGNVLSWDWPTIPAPSGPDQLVVTAEVISKPPGAMTVDAKITSDTAEAHKDNNQADVLIGNKFELFLPMHGYTP